MRMKEKPHCSSCNFSQTDANHHFSWSPIFLANYLLSQHDSVFLRKIILVSLLSLKLFWTYLCRVYQHNFHLVHLFETRVWSRKVNIRYITLSRFAIIVILVPTSLLSTAWYGWFAIIKRNSSCWIGFTCVPGMEFYQFTWYICNSAIA